MPRPPPGRLSLSAGTGDAGETLARFVARRGGVAEEAARAAIERGGAFLRGKRIRDASARVAAGDRVEVSLRAEARHVELDRSRLLHLDELVVAVDKPAGVMAQEGKAGGPALADLCAALLARLGERAVHALLVHRLDRGTTGATVLARTRRSQAALLAAFRERRVRKEYRALVVGSPREDEAILDLPLAPDPRSPGSRRVDPGGEPACTRFRVLERFEGASLLAALPETGRTHQIRVHLREMGCPLLGDRRYGGPAQLTRADGTRIDFDRPMLHALSLELPHPAADGDLRLRAPEPLDFTQACARLRTR